MSTEPLQRPIFFSIRKNSSFFSWRPYGEFLNYLTVCIEAVSEEEFVLRQGPCLPVHRLGQKRLVSATRFRMLRNGIYILTEEKDGKYIFHLVAPLRRKT